MCTHCEDITGIRWIKDVRAHWHSQTAVQRANLSGFQSVTVENRLAAGFVG